MYISVYLTTHPPLKLETKTCEQRDFYYTSNENQQEKGALIQKEAKIADTLWHIPVSVTGSRDSDATLRNSFVLDGSSKSL